MKVNLFVYITFLSYISIFGIDKSDKYYGAHGWGVLDNVVNNTPYSMLFYSDPRGLSSQLPDRTTIRIRSLKTGFGGYYGVKKDKEGKWRLYADVQDPKNPAAQFTVHALSAESTNILISSQAAGKLFLESDPKTYEVFLSSDKVSENATWELVEDSRAGDTLDCCFLRNKATKGFLAASYDLSGSDGDDEISKINAEIAKLEQTIPYLKITYARTEGILNKFDSDLSRDIKDKLKDYISHEGELEVTEKDWVSKFSGISTTRWKWGSAKHHRTRDVIIRYMEGSDKQEKEKKFSNTEGKPIKITADIEKHPATALKRKLAELTVKTENLQSLKKREIASTGMEGKVFEANQWSKISIEALTSFGSDDDRGAPKETIGAKGSRDLKVPAHRRPEFKGFGEERIENFGVTSLITLKPLYSKGFAWIDQSLPIQGQGTIIFGVVAEEGDVQVCLSDSAAPHAIYRIAFGAEANTKAILYKDDLPVQVVTKEQNPLVRLVPGVFELLWVSVNKGFILVGKDSPGTNILMAWQDPNPALGIEKVGFSTFKKTVKFAGAERIADPLVFVAPNIQYVSEKGSVESGTESSPAWSKYPISPADAGTVVFNIIGQNESIIALANESGDGYLVNFGSDGNTATKIYRIKDKRELYKIDTNKLPLAKLDADKINKFWVTFYKGNFFLGRGEIGKNVFGAFVDADYTKGISKIGFAGKSSITDLEIWPEVELSFDKEISEYVSKKQFSPFSGTLIILSPFEYRIRQEGPSIQFVNRLETGGSGRTYNVGATPTPDGDYHFRLEISSTGVPKLTYLFDNPSAEQIKLEQAAIVSDAVADASFKAATASGKSGNFTSDVAWTSLGTAMAFSAAGVAAATVSGGVKAKLSEIQKLSQRYVFTEEVEETPRSRAEIDTKEISHGESIKSNIDLIRTKKITTDIGELDYVTKLWDNVLQLATSSVAVDYNSNKENIMSGMREIYNVVKDLKLDNKTEHIYNRTVDVLIKAYNNKFVFDPGNVTDSMRRKDLYLWINQLAKTIFKDPEMSKDGIGVNFKGEYLWLPNQLPVPGKGAIIFEAKGFNNAFIGLSENPYQVRNKPTRMYEIIIGKWDNTKTSIHRKSLGDAVVEFDHDVIPGLSLEPEEFKPYWINIDKGVITGGVGKLGQNKLWEWKDPYPAAPVKYVGLSNWINEVTYRNVRVGTFAELKDVKVAPIPVAKAKKTKGKSKPVATKTKVKQVGKKAVTASKVQPVAAKSKGKPASKAKVKKSK